MEPGSSTEDAAAIPEYSALLQPDTPKQPMLLFHVPEVEESHSQQVVHDTGQPLEEVSVSVCLKTVQVWAIFPLSALPVLMSDCITYRQRRPSLISSAISTPIPILSAWSCRRWRRHCPRLLIRIILPTCCRGIPRRPLVPLRCVSSSYNHQFLCPLLSTFTLDSPPGGC